MDAVSRCQALFEGGFMFYHYLSYYLSKWNKLLLFKFAYAHLATRQLKWKIDFWLL